MTRDVHRWLREYYGVQLTTSADLKTNACCAAEPPRRLLGPLSNIHHRVSGRFYGCGYPIPQRLDGAVAVDLGCGSGRDVYLLSQLVGPNGFVHGVDMTEAQLAVARDTLEWHMDRFGYERANVALHRGYIEELDMLEDATADVVVSNCVVNLSPRKDVVLAEAFRVLKPGGELYISDVVADRRLPAEVALDPVLHAECLGGAMYDHDLTALARRTGFLDPREISRAPITIDNDEVLSRVGAATPTTRTGAAAPDRPKERLRAWAGCRYAASATGGAARGN